MTGTGGTIANGRDAEVGRDPVVVFDLASLRFCATEHGLTLMTKGGTALAHARIPVDDRREAAAKILTTAAATGRVWRDGMLCRIGLYHPETGEVAVGASPRHVTLRGHGPLALETEGTSGHWDGEVLVVGDVRLAPVRRDVGELLARLLAQ